VPRWERKKSLLVVGAAAAAIAAWALAFQTGAESPEWNAEWRLPSASRGKTISINSRDVETDAERAKRLAPIGDKEVREDLGAVKRSILGDKRPMRGNDIEPEEQELTPDVEYNPREACLQMKLEYPERYGNVDCMSDKYNSNEVWWKVGPHGE
jgi:hypothetical protein